VGGVIFLCVETRNERQFMGIRAGDECTLERESIRVERCSSVGYVVLGVGGFFSLRLEDPPSH